MFWCKSCEYKTDRKFNLKTHIKNKHNRDATDDELSKEQISSKMEQISSEVEQISSEVEQISSKKGTNIIQNGTNIIPKRQKNMACKKCSKNFKSLKGFKKHEDICKGVSNPLECHHCHHIFATPQSKSKHIKICKIKEAQLIVKDYNQTNNIQNNNNQHIYYNYTINNNVYRSSNNMYIDNDNHYNINNINEFGKEDISYIEPKKMEKIVLNCDVKTLIKEKHFNPLHPENQNVRVNCNKSYKVLKGNQWQVETKDTIQTSMYNNTKSDIHNYAHNHLFHKILNDDDIDEFITKFLELDNTCRKKVCNFIDVNLRELAKQRKMPIKEDCHLLENCDTNLLTN